MHDLDADVGVSSQESGLKVYILPRRRGFTSTMRVKSPHAQKPGRQHLNNVQKSPAWSQAQRSYRRTTSDMKLEQITSIGGDLEQKKPAKTTEGAKDASKSKVTHIREMLTMPEKVSAFKEESRVSKSHLGNESRLNIWSSMSCPHDATV